MAPVNEYLVITGGVPDNHPIILDLFREKYINSDSPDRSQFYAAYGSVLLNC